MARSVQLDSDGDDDSLYAHPRQAGHSKDHNRSVQPSGAAQSQSPTPSVSSDKENRGASLQTDKSSSRTLTSNSLTPASDRENKRRRLANGAGRADVDEVIDLQFYNPDQSMDERRSIRKGLRDLNRKLNDNATEYISSSTGLIDTLNTTNKIYDRVRQTADATLDSRLLVQVADLSHKRSRQLTLGEGTSGVDVDEFVNKCRSYMRTERSGGRRRSHDEMEDDFQGDHLDWVRFGRELCFPHNRRPPTPSFLLGPLSVQKRLRQKPVRRPANSQRNLETTRPQELQAADLERNENANLTNLCSKMLRTLNSSIAKSHHAIEGKIDGDMPKSEQQKILADNGLTDAGGMSFFKFIINPHSFSQTVENLFYVSFLIRDSHVAIDSDTNGLPSLYPVSEETKEQVKAQGTEAMKHQGVFNLTYAKYKKLVEVFDIKECMVEDRNEAREEIAEGHWYA